MSCVITCTLCVLCRLPYIYSNANINSNKEEEDFLLHIHELSETRTIFQHQIIVHFEASLVLVCPYLTLYSTTPLVHDQDSTALDLILAREHCLVASSSPVLVEGFLCGHQMIEKEEESKVSCSRAC